jgi:DNA primase
VFNREGIEGQPEIILCEALIDALTFWSAGYRNVTSGYGVNGFTDELLAAFKACGAQRVLIAFDRDEPGDRAADVLAKRWMAEGLDCFRLKFPKGMDANAYATSVMPPETSLGVVIRAAEWLGAGAKPALTTRCFGSVHQWVDGDEARPAASRSAAGRSAVGNPADLLTEQPAASVAAESAGTPSVAITATAEPLLPLAVEMVTADPPPQTAAETALPEPVAAAMPSSPALPLIATACS